MTKDVGNRTARHKSPAYFVSRLICHFFGRNCNRTADMMGSAQPSARAGGGGEDAALYLAQIAAHAGGGDAALYPAQNDGKTASVNNDYNA